MPQAQFQVQAQAVSPYPRDPADLSESPTVLLERILSGRGEEAIAALCSHLAGTDYSIIDLLDDVARLKERLAKQLPPERLVECWTLLDRAVSEAAARTSLFHEKFIETTLHAFCHYDEAGIIIGANHRMLELNPYCIGRPLADHLGRMDPDLGLVLAGGGTRRLYVLDLRTKEGEIPVLAEFGSFDVNGRRGGYALLVDMSNLVDAERKALESASDGMLKLDAKHRILYASEKAVELFEASRVELIGCDARRLLSDVRDRGSVTKVVRQSLERRKGRGGEYEILLTKPLSGKQTHVRVTSTPFFDAVGAYWGSIARLQPIDHFVAREEMARLVATEPNYRILFEKIAAVVQRFIDFDWATLFIYSPKRDYSRTVCWHGPQIDFPSRWFPTPDGYIDWLKQEETWVGDLKDYPPRVRDRPDIQAAIAGGMAALVCVPIETAGQILGGFCLTSRRPGVYNLESRKVLERLMVQQALLPVFHAIEQEEREFVSALTKNIAASEDHQELAGIVVGELACHYGFQNVSIFKVNLLREHFRLLAQSLGPKGGTAMPEGYTQPFGEGLIGLAYEHSKRCDEPGCDYTILNDTLGNSLEARAYKTVAPEIRSELCIPIRLFGRILWILNLEDCHTDAFTPIEVAALRGVIEQMQSTLERIFQNLVLIQVLDVCPVGVVITDQKYNILRSNKEARQMLQRDALTESDNLTTFIEKDAPADFSAEPALGTLIDVKGNSIPALISKSTLEEEYDHVVFALQNVTNLQWTTNFERLKAALAESTAQVRVPVSLIASYVHRIARATQDGSIQELITKAIRQLGRVELTYDRVLASYDAQSMPARKKITFDVNLAIQHILSDLPELERQGIRFRSDAQGTVRADPYRILFALNSMLAYLVRSRGDASPIKVKVHKAHDHVEVSMTGAVQKCPTIGQLGALMEQTRAEIALSPEGLARIAEEANGSFWHEAQPNGRERLLFRLPALG